MSGFENIVPGDGSSGLRSGAKVHVDTVGRGHFEGTFEYLHVEDDLSLTIVFRVGGELQGWSLGALRMIEVVDPGQESEGELREAFGR